MSASHGYRPAWLSEPTDLNALDGRLWPTGTNRNDDGQLAIRDLQVSDLVETTQTPAYLYDKATAVDAAQDILRAYREALEPLDVDLHPYYASKAFSSHKFLRWIIAEGFGVDVASEGELAMAIAAGADPAHIGVHGNNKSDALLERAVGLGVGSIVLDSAEEVERVAVVASRLGVVQPVRLRVTTGVHAETHDFLATAVEDQKFGVALRDVTEIVKHIHANSALRFLGMHSHIGSQIFNADGFAAAIDRLMEMQATLLKLGDAPELNIGGGYGVAYTSAEHPLPIRSIVHEIVAVLRTTADRHNVPIPTIAIEPGRFLAGPSGVTVYRVGAIKDVIVHDDDGNEARRKYVAVDGGMSDNPRPELYGADYTAVLARSSSAAPALTRVVGMHCESGDIVVRDVYLPSDVHRGDVLVVPVTGAYCASLSSNYNLVPRPGIWGIVNEQLEPLVRRETIEDLLARDVGADGVNR